MSIEDVIRGRRTVHVFQPEVPPIELIEKAIDVARWAPNHRSTEPWQFLSLGKSAIGRIVDLNAQIVAAKSGAEAGEAKRRQWSTVPGWLVVTSTRLDDRFAEDEDYAATCCAIQNLSLFLWEQGIGVKWTTGKVTQHPEFFSLLGIDPSKRRIVGMLWYGYPSEVPTQTRKEVSEILVQVE